MRCADEGGEGRGTLVVIFLARVCVQTYSGEKNIAPSQGLIPNLIMATGHAE